jgi:hypothetical protein
VEHGNPVEVRARTVPGRPTVREADILSGNRMAQEANAGSRKASGKREMLAGAPPDLPYNRPDTG